MSVFRGGLFLHRGTIWPQLTCLFQALGLPSGPFRVRFGRFSDVHFPCRACPFSAEASFWCLEICVQGYCSIGGFRALLLHQASLNRRFSRTSVPCLRFRWVEKYRIVALPVGGKVSHLLALLWVEKYLLLFIWLLFSFSAIRHFSS